MLETVMRFWRSKESTIAGAFLAVCGLAMTTPGAAALTTLGLPAWLVAKLAAISVVIGALLVTPKDAKPNA